MKVAVLAGGLGTRLAGLTGDLPKPMVEVGGKPFLTYVLAAFAERGLHQFVLLAGYRAGAIRDYFGDGARLGYRIEYSIEQQPLGTGGAVRDARQLLGNRFLIAYGDVYRRFDYDRFVRAHRSPCLAVYPYDPSLTTIDAGNIALDESRMRVSVYRKGAHELRLPYVDAGFALLEKSALDLLPPQGTCSLENDLYAPLAAVGGLEAEVVDRNFLDIGNPADLAQTRKAFGG